MAGKWRCKFSIATEIDRRCAKSIDLKVTCNGDNEERYRCPYWAQTYHKDEDDYTRDQPNKT